MRRLLTLILLSPFYLFAQVPDSINAYLKNYSVQDRTVSYVKVFEVDGKTKPEIKDLLISSFSGVPKVTINQTSISEDQIAGSFSNHVIDYKKYGGTWGSTVGWVKFPISGRFTFQIKDNRYRLLVTDIVATSSSLSLNFNSDFSTRENTLRGLNNKPTTTGYYYFARSLEDLFYVDVDNKKDDW